MSRLLSTVMCRQWSLHQKVLKVGIFVSFLLDINSFLVNGYCLRFGLLGLVRLLRAMCLSPRKLLIRRPQTVMLHPSSMQSAPGIPGHNTVRLEPSVIHNEWENGTFDTSIIWFVGYSVLFLSSLSFLLVCLLTVYLDFFSDVLNIVVWCLAGLDVVLPGSPILMSAAQCLMLARSTARAEWTETSKETTTVAKRK